MALNNQREAVRRLGERREGAVDSEEAGVPGDRWLAVDLVEDVALRPRHRVDRARRVPAADDLDADADAARRGRRGRRRRRPLRRGRPGRRPRSPARAARRGRRRGRGGRRRAAAGGRRGSARRGSAGRRRGGARRRRRRSARRSPPPARRRAAPRRSPGRPRPRPVGRVVEPGEEERTVGGQAGVGELGDRLAAQPQALRPDRGEGREGARQTLVGSEEAEDEVGGPAGLRRRGEQDLARAGSRGQVDGSAPHGAPGRAGGPEPAASTLPVLRS